MTPQQPEPQKHCEHECVLCYIYAGVGQPCFESVCEYDTRSRPATAPEPKFTSTDLLILSHDEWKRREERKHLHDETPWVAGFINGFLTDKKWAMEHLDKIQQEARR